MKVSADIAFLFSDYGPIPRACFLSLDSYFGCAEEGRSCIIRVAQAFCRRQDQRTYYFNWRVRSGDEETRLSQDGSSYHEF